MAAITVADCQFQVKSEGGFRQVLIKTPSTADSADTLDLTSFINGEDIAGVQAWDATSVDSVTCTVSGATATLDASGGTTNHTYYILVTLGF